MGEDFTSNGDFQAVHAGAIGLALLARHNVLRENYTLFWPMQSPPVTYTTLQSSELSKMKGGDVLLLFD